MENVDGWLIQVTTGDPRDGEQGVEMYAAWDQSEDNAVSMVIREFAPREDQIVAIVDTLSADLLTKLGLSPGQAGPYVEDQVAD